MTPTLHPTGIARRENGLPPPEVPLGDIDLGSIDFWDPDEDLRDGAFATLRRESPITFFDVAEFSGSMINLDDPRHLRLRTIVNRAFTPKVVARIEGSVRDRARTIVTNMVANHHDALAEFVSEASGLLPLQVICDMMGIPEEDEAKVFHWTNVVLGVGDKEVSGE